MHTPVGQACAPYKGNLRKGAKAEGVAAPRPMGTGVPQHAFLQEAVHCCWVRGELVPPVPQDTKATKQHSSWVSALQIPFRSPLQLMARSPKQFYRRLESWTVRVRASLPCHSGQSAGERPGTGLAVLDFAETKVMMAQRNRREWAQLPPQPRA